MTDDLTAFVTARLDDDEHELEKDPPVGLGYANLTARLRLDIAAKRAILALHATEVSRQQYHALAEDIADGKPLWWYEDECSCVICGWFDSSKGGCLTKQHLATGWSDDPRHKQEWKP